MEKPYAFGLLSFHQVRIRRAWFCSPFGLLWVCCWWHLEGFLRLTSTWNQNVEQSHPVYSTSSSPSPNHNQSRSCIQVCWSPLGHPRTTNLPRGILEASVSLVHRRSSYLLRSSLVQQYTASVKPEEMEFLLSDTPPLSFLSEIAWKKKVLWLWYCYYCLSNWKPRQLGNDTANTDQG